MKEILWFLKLWYLINVIATRFNVYFFLQSILQVSVDAWVYLALLCFDAATWLSKTTNFNACLCRMTRWAPPIFDKAASTQERTETPPDPLSNDLRRQQQAPLGNHTPTLA
jgi:hypothetical protein